MIKAILFDLDDTLLGNNMDTFLPGYFNLCGQYAQRYLPQDEFLRVLMLASRTMVENTDPALTNDEVFWARFNDLTDLDSRLVASDFDSFYRNEFEQLRPLTEHSPFAARLVESSLQQGLQVVIATNPMFPRAAVEARLAWAGVSIADYDYALVTTMENMHATKPHEAYYREILEAIACQPHEALMIGDDGKRDIEPAFKLGLYTYWIQLANSELPQGVVPTGQGSLRELADCIENGWLLSLDTAV